MRNALAWPIFGIFADYIYTRDPEAIDVMKAFSFHFTASNTFMVIEKNKRFHRTTLFEKNTTHLVFSERPPGRE